MSCPYDGALRALQHLSAHSEDHSPHDHYPKHVLQAANAEDELPNHAEHAGQDEHHPRPNAVDQRPSDQRNYDVGEGVDCVEQVELGLAQRFVVLVLVVVLDELLERLFGRRLTLGLSKAY
jgi:hypothetical protein